MNDLYTVAVSSKGNKALTYPVGLITSDEVVYAGGFGGKANSTYWLYTNQNYWTMSPYIFSGNAILFQVCDDGRLNTGMYPTVTGNNGARSVLNLDKNVQLTGSGTTIDPYKIIE